MLGGQQAGAGGWTYWQVGVGHVSHGCWEALFQAAGGLDQQGGQQPQGVTDRQHSSFLLSSLFGDKGGDQ